MLKRKKNLIIALSTLLLLQNFPLITAFAEPINYGSVITSRLAGADRYATSIAISKSGWNHATNVIISTGSNFPDALSASALSKSKDAPIILISKDSLSSDAIVELKRLGISNAYLIGGTGVISNSVENQLKSLNISIIRFDGIDRYDTSTKIANYMGVNNGIVVATGADFPDALSVAPIAAMKSMPILLSKKSGLDPNMSAFIKGKNIPISYIIGGTGALESSIDTSLPNSKRLSGNDRFGTNLNINNQFASDLSFDTVYLATGLDFPDALSGSALAAKKNAPIILTDKDTISTDILNLMKNNNVKHVVILGGTGVVSQDVEDNVVVRLNTDLAYIDAAEIAVKAAEASRKSSDIAAAKAAVVLVKDSIKSAAFTARINAIKVLVDVSLVRGDEVVRYALNFIGIPYVWGGNSPIPGFDCSGFMQYVYAHVGVEIARETKDQVTNGYEVSIAQLQQGDLVFFGDKSAPNHVGMYIGNGQYIHAPKTGDVIKVSDLAGRSDFCIARRIFN
jgi:cell wall-associated NlpC family hydrolase/putative cell wall-binding protein